MMSEGGERRAQGVKSQQRRTLMIRYWVKMLVLAVLILIQTACPKLLTKQQNTSSSDGAQEQGGTG